MFKTIVIIIICFVLGWMVLYPTITYRYRLTIEFNTPDGIKSGSSVIEVKTDQWPKFLSNLFGGKTADVNYIGEAVFVDLGNGKNAVGLLSHGHYGQINRIRKLAPMAFLNTRFTSSSTSGASKKISQLIGSSEELTRDLIPTIATFKDLNKPESVEVIYGTTRNENDNSEIVTLDKMESTFGSGFSFESAIIIERQLTCPVDDN